MWAKKYKGTDLIAQIGRLICTFMHQVLETPAPFGLGIGGAIRALLSCFDLRYVPGVPWNSRGFDSMIKLVVNLLHLGKAFGRVLIIINVFSVLGILPGFAKRKVNIPGIPRPGRAHGYKLLVLYLFTYYYANAQYILYATLNLARSLFIKMEHRCKMFMHHKLKTILNKSKKHKIEK